jgi:hypothetical protein
MELRRAKGEYSTQRRRVNYFWRINEKSVDITFNVEHNSMQESRPTKQQAYPSGSVLVS